MRASCRKRWPRSSRRRRLPDELIAVDDGSSDESAGLIAQWARTAPFAVTLVRQANAGAHVALNRGMAIARGEIVALMNSDDAYAPGRLARSGRCARCRPCARIFRREVGRRRGSACAHRLRAGACGPNRRAAPPAEPVVRADPSQRGRVDRQPRLSPQAPGRRRRIRGAARMP